MGCGIKKCSSCPRELKQCQMTNGKCPDCARKDNEERAKQNMQTITNNLNVSNQPYINR
jgi:hypothetical protein